MGAVGETCSTLDVLPVFTDDDLLGTGAATDAGVAGGGEGVSLPSSRDESRRQNWAILCGVESIEERILCRVLPYAVFMADRL